MAATISGDGTSTLINLTTSGNTVLGDASTDTLNVGNGGLVKDASGNVGIGTSLPHASAKLHIFATGDYTDESAPFTLGNSSTNGMRLYAGVNNTNDYAYIGSVESGTAYRNLVLQPNGGNLLVGTTSQLANTSFASFSTGNGWVLGIRNTANSSGINITNGSGTASYPAIGFYNNGLSYSSCGTVTVSGTTTTYGTSSDYRMKENVQPMTGALARVAALKPVTYTWKSTGEEGEGFIAHELQEVCPSAVVGEKDAVDEDGKIKPQNIDTSFLVATLTAAIKEQQAIITQLQADVAALKGTA